MRKRFEQLYRFARAAQVDQQSADLALVVDRQRRQVAGMGVEELLRRGELVFGDERLRHTDCGAQPEFGIGQQGLELLASQLVLRNRSSTSASIRRY